MNNKNQTKQKEKRDFSVIFKYKECWMQNFITRHHPAINPFMFRQ